MARLEVVVGPDAVVQALKEGRRVVELFVAEGTPAATGAAAELARAEGIPVRIVPDSRIHEESGGRQADGVLAYVKSEGYANLADLLALAKGRSEPPLILAVDAEEDANALGGLIRMADLGHVHGVLVPARATGITAQVAKAAKGALENVKVARVQNLPEALARLRDQGLAIVGVDPEGEPLHECDLGGPLALVLPPEGHRLSSTVVSACQRLVAPPFGADSMALPLAVTAGLVLYEKIRRQAAHAVRAARAA